MNKKQKKILIRIITAAALTLLLNLLPITGALKLVLFLGAYLIIGYDILKKAIFGLFSGRLLDENFLMAVATVGAFALALIEKSGDYNEAVAVMLFYQTGELFQSVAVGKSRKNIAALMDIRPDHANIETDGVLTQVDPALIAAGSIIIVRPGERISLDGRVTEGESELDTSALTGESVPREVKAGDEVQSGCINGSGELKIRTSSEFAESTVSKILELVENASSRKSRSEKFISKFARVYTPAVCAAALLLAILPPIVAMILGAEAEWTVWLYRALTFLVISCPCALVISIPLGFFGAIGGASREGILIKGSNYIETLARVKYIAFDKTGTLTRGSFDVCDVVSDSVGQRELLMVAAYAESSSLHPIGRSIVRAYGEEIDRSRVSDVCETRGRGVTVKLDGETVAAGNLRLMESLGVECPEHYEGCAVYIARSGRYLGAVLLEDRIKENSASAIAQLRAMGVKSTLMLTGDRREVAEKVAKQAGLDSYRAELMPADKIGEIEKLLSEKGAGESVAFVGDGINDAPVLARSDVGIAMGGIGSDAAIEAADVVLMRDDPGQIATALRISRKCMRIVKQNIIFSLAVKFACLALASFGAANMWLGIFADVGVMVLAVLNSIRAMRVK